MIRWLAGNLAGSLLAGWLLHLSWGTPAPAPASPARPPQAQVSPAVLDLGTVPTGRSAFGTLSLKNSGTGPLDFRVETSCLCLTARQTVSHLEPGQQCEVTVRFYLPLPGRHEKELLLISNEPGRPVIALPVHVQVGP